MPDAAPPGPTVSVVLPTYSESGSIGAVLGRVDEAMVRAGISWEAVVVDDDSPDGTADVARRAADGLSGAVRVIVRRDERGLGTAVVRGMEEARGWFVCVMDADGQHPATAVADMVRLAASTDADLVIGSRHIEGGSTGSFAWYRRLVSWGAGLAARAALSAVRRNRLTDPMSGLFLVRRVCLEGVTLRPRGYKVLLDVLVRAKPQHGRLDVREVGYVFGAREAGASKLDAGVALDFLGHLARVALMDRQNRRIGAWSLAVLTVAAMGAVVWFVL